MTDKELRKLNRGALLEMLVDQSQENDRLRDQVEELKRQLSDRQLQINQAGSIAEASLQISHVFEAAQQAAEQYLENIQSLNGRQEEICRQMEEDSSRQAKALLEETERKCQAMEEDSSRQAKTLLEETERKCQAMEAEAAEKCSRLTKEAEESAERTWKEVQVKIQQLIDGQSGLRELLNVAARGSNQS